VRDHVLDVAARDVLAPFARDLESEVRTEPDVERVELVRQTSNTPAPTCRLMPRRTRMSSTGFSRYAMPSAPRIGASTPVR
jgi:hypothetical protein